MFHLLLVASLLLGAQSYRVSPEPVIIGGEDVDPVGKWPFQLSLQILDQGEYRHTCGAVLISEQWVLTAAHCTDGRTGFAIITGAHDIQSQEEGNPTLIDIDEIIEHEDYSPFFLTNDIGLLHLATPADVTDEYVDIVALAPSDAPDFVGPDCWIIGWGTTQVNDDGSLVLPDILQEAQIDVMPNDDCNDLYGGGIEDSMICVGVPGEIGGCFGDSGGPTVCDVDGVWTHVGIASFVADSFCDTDYPTVYTRSSSFRQWITENSGV